MAAASAEPTLDGGVDLDGGCEDMGRQGGRRTCSRTECLGSSLELQPSSTSVVTTTAQMCPGMFTCAAHPPLLHGASTPSARRIHPSCMLQRCWASGSGTAGLDTGTLAARMRQQPDDMAPPPAGAHTLTLQEARVGGTGSQEHK